MLGPITVIQGDSCYQNNILESWFRLLRILDVPSKRSVRNSVGPAQFVSRAPDKSIVSLSGAFDLLCIAPLSAARPLAPAWRARNAADWRKQRICHGS